MMLSLIKKDIIIFVRSRIVSTSLLFVFLIGFILIVYSHGMLRDNDIAEPVVQISFLQNHLMIVIFPVIVINILSLAFSLTKEKSGFLLAKTLPSGAGNFLKSKVLVNTSVAGITAVIYLLTVIFYNGLDIFYFSNIFFSLLFFILFFIAGISNFTMAFATRFYDPLNDFEPGVKGMMALMFFISVFVIAGFSFTALNMRYLYEYKMCYRQDYPNVEFIIMILTGYFYWILTRVFLSIASRKDFL